MAWKLTAGLQNFVDQFNEAFPGRDRASDGSIGDTAHQAEMSGHNPDDTPGSRAEWSGDSDSAAEVRAKDLDSDLRSPGVSMQDVVDHLRRLPNLGSVLRYMIYNRKIYSASNGFQPVAYVGPSPHTEHLHVSGAFSQAADENTTFDFRLGDLVDVKILSEGDTGEAVGMWQQKLARIGFSAGELDNDYGPKMAAAIQKFRLSLVKDAKAYKYLTGWTAFWIDQRLAQINAREAIVEALKTLPPSPFPAELIGKIEGGALNIRLTTPTV